MLKKINMVITAFFLILTLKSPFLLAIYLPVLLFYLFKDQKNMYYIYPVSLISVLFFTKEYLILYLIIIICTSLFLLAYKIAIQKNNFLFSYPKIIISIFIFTINIICVFIYKIPLAFKIINPLLSILIYLFLDYYLEKLLKDLETFSERSFINDNKTYHKYIYLEILLGLLTSIGASYLTIRNINIGLIISCYFAMYLSRKFRNIYSLFFSLIMMFIEYIFFKIPESMIILMISGIYSVRSIYTIGILNAYLVGEIFLNHNIIYILIMVLTIIFEILSTFFMKNNTDDVDEYRLLHEAAQKNVNDEILKFALVLDRFVQSFKNPKGFNEKLSNGIKTIMDKHCKSCLKQKECYNKNKNTLYHTFKDILMLNEDALYTNEEFQKDCNKYQSIINTSKLLNEKINYQNLNSDEKDANNFILLAQISGVSSALKNYVVDATTKIELNYQSLYKAKEYLTELEYYVTYYEIIRSYEHDFLIKIGLKNTTLDKVQKTLETLFETITNEEVTIKQIETSNTTIYIHIMPKLIIDVSYAYGNIPEDDEIISGDNYLIKEQDSGHILFAISDGMGKGYSAFYESDMTLKLVEDIVQLNIDPSTALEILNTFYTVQDYLERYATLDFLDINRHTGQANFYKMAANSTYIFKANGQIIKIVNKNLPLGIDEEVGQNTYNLEDDDLIIMSSDGVLENLIDNESLESFIKSLRDLLPQQIVYEILNYTSTHTKKVKDDMTIIVLKISKNE